MRHTMIAAAIGLAVLAAGAGAGAQAMPGMAHHHHEEASRGEKLGRVAFPTSCAPAVQARFERGVALLHSFGYVKAEQQFTAVAKADPTCALAHWGVAMSRYHPLWAQPEPDDLKVGAAEMAAARSLAARATPRERAYVEALSAFYAPADAPHQVRADAYAARMDALHSAYPDDVEGAAFDALAILGDTPPTDDTLEHAHRALAILQPLFAAHPDHPGLAHYIIHTCDTPAPAAEGLPAARVYARIAPASPHALHMPAHLFARRGLWREDIASNLASLAASNAAAAAHEPGAAHQMHAQEFLIYAYLQTGQARKAEALTARMGSVGGAMAAMPGLDDMKDAGGFFDSELQAIYAYETHQWARLAALRPPGGAKPYEVFPTYWGQGLAAGRLHDPAKAAKALAAFDASFEAVKTSPFASGVGSLEIKRDELLGWRAFTEDRPEAALAALRKAADQQDKLGQDEVDIPAREMLADLLMLQHRPKEALAEYRVALTLSPNRLNGLKGAAAAARAAGRSTEARRFKAAAARQTAVAHALRS